MTPKIINLNFGFWVRLPLNLGFGFLIAGHFDTQQRSHRLKETQFKELRRRNLLTRPLENSEESCDTVKRIIEIYINFKEGTKHFILLKKKVLVESLRDFFIPFTKLSRIAIIFFHKWSLSVNFDCVLNVCTWGMDVGAQCRPSCKSSRHHKASSPSKFQRENEEE